MTIRNKRFISLSFSISIISLLLSCNSDNNGDEEPPMNDIVFPVVDGLEVFEGSKVHDGFILVNDASANRVYLMDKTTEIIHEWDLNGKRLGNDAYLLDDGRLLAMLESENPVITLGGFGGLLALLDKEGNIQWSYEYSNENHIAHHDAEMLPNGNIIFLAWQKRSVEEAIESGYSIEDEVIYDAVLEINPNTNEIVWEWHMWDHLIQDHDDTKLNFGSISDNPGLIDFNYVDTTNAPGDISHANGVSYDAQKDVIYISANFYDEIWVIDHSTSKEEAAGNTGGNYGKGGNLIYRFGNPDAYDNPEGPIRFDRNHHPNLLANEGNENILVFVNGNSISQSTAYELKLPDELKLESNSNNEPEVEWSFTDPDLFSGRVSGVDLLPNGNRLITEGDFGFWEVTFDGDVIWRYNTLGFFWRGYHYDKESPGVLALGL